MSIFDLQIISPDKIEFEGPVASVVAPGEDGYFGVLADHAPLISNLKQGILSYQPKEGDRVRYIVTGGFLEVSHNKVVILVEHIEPAPPEEEK